MTNESNKKKTDDDDTMKKEIKLEKNGYWTILCFNLFFGYC